MMYPGILPFGDVRNVVPTTVVVELRGWAGWRAVERGTRRLHLLRLGCADAAGEGRRLGHPTPAALGLAVPGGGSIAMQTVLPACH